MATFRKYHRVNVGRFTAVVARSAELDEYRVRFLWLTPEADYFTPSKEDALDTAELECRRADIADARRDPERSPQSWPTCTCGHSAHSHNRPLSEVFTRNFGCDHCSCVRYKAAV